VRVSIVDALLAQGYALVETHISWVLIGERDVWKVKKPVDLGFLDFTTLEARERACRAEVELNLRLAPGVYLGAVPVTDDPGGPRLGGDGPVIDFAVHMRRLADRDRADVRLAEGRLDHAAIEAITGAIAGFHEAARRSPEIDVYGALDRIADNVQENFRQTKGTVDHYLQPPEAAELERFQLGFLREHADRFAARVATGRVCEGHGDLRLEHVYVTDDGSLSIIDCIEFNERFRHADVCADIAFLAMDLARLGRMDLSEHCLASYARAADDHDLYGVVDFYESYRAHVRAKIASIVAENPHTPVRVRERMAGEARRDYLLALAADRRSVLSPLCVAVGGIIATGKSTIAELVSRERSAPIVDADRTRKFMLGARPTDRLHTGAWQGAYDPGFTEQVYAEVLRRAEVVLASGRPVIVDASFRSRAMRAQAKALADRMGVPFRFVECRADPELCRARLRARAQGSSVSDGRLEIFDDFVASYEPVSQHDGFAPEEAIVLDTGEPLHVTTKKLREHVSTWPVGLHGP
jgi:aminoglycoside phosphotransferase family enzyme/predicted kinase